MLTNKQNKYLKSLAHKLKPIYQVGKDGVTDNMICDVLNYLKKYEICKVKVLQNCDFSNEEVALSFEGANVIVVQTIGSTITLYKENKKLNNSIKLP